MRPAARSAARKRSNSASAASSSPPTSTTAERRAALGGGRASGRRRIERFEPHVMGTAEGDPPESGEGVLGSADELRHRPRLGIESMLGAAAPIDLQPDLDFPGVDL